MLHSSHLKVLAIASLLCLAQLMSAQTKVTVSGTVKDAKGAPVVGAFIYETGTLNGTSTNNDGEYSLTAPANAKVTVECIGFATQEFNAVASNAYDIVLEDDALFLDDVVVVGYSTTTRRDLISSVSQVKTEQISNLPTTSISQGLAGRSPGLIVTESGGGAVVNPTISIRGGADPLYVIDGVIRTKADFIVLSPEDIDQMNILKDASATAIYGARASNGIIQVVTKKGARGKVAVDYDFTQSFAQPSYWQKTTRLWERYEYANIGAANDGIDPLFSEEAIELAKQGLDALGRPMQVTRDLVLRDWAPQQKHNIRINAGNDISQLYASVGYVDNNSLYANVDDHLRRTTFRMAETVNLKKIGVQINATVDGFSQNTRTPWTTMDPGYRTAFGDMQNAPEKVLLNKYGLPLSLGNVNLVAELSDDAGYSRTNSNVINAKAEAIWNVLWVKGLKVRLSTDYRFDFEDSKVWAQDPGTYEWDSQTPSYSRKSSLTKTYGKTVAYTNQAFLEYANTFGNHSVSAVGGFEQYYETSDYSELARTEYEFRVDQISVGPADNQTNNSVEAELGRAAWIGQVRYNYAGKYFAEASIRYDGSDYFAPGKRWGAFYGGSLGWVVTSEPWMKPLVDKNILNMLKIRASYGQTGLDSSAGRFAYLKAYTINPKGYVVDNTYTPTFSEGDLPSPDLTWYTTYQTDLGFDFASMNNRLYGSFDYFFYKTYGFLVAPTGQSYLNTIMGVGMPKVKSESEQRREGIEIQLGWRNTIGDFSYDISGNLTYFESLWAYDQSEPEASYMNPYTRTQQSTAYYSNLYHVLGYYADQDDVFNSVAYLAGIQSGYLTPGDIKYEDTNGDGQITDADLRHLGKSSMPRCQYGINIAMGYKGFYFSTLLQGSTRSNLYIGGTNSMDTQHAGSTTTLYPYQKDTWTPTNTDAAYPKLTSNSNLNSKNNYLSSDFWLLDCGYLRVKDLQFGYDFKYSALKDIQWLSRLKVGISGQNLLTASKAKKYGMDPENINASGYGYPVSRTVALTVNVGF